MSLLKVGNFQLQIFFPTENLCRPITFYNFFSGGNLAFRLSKYHRRRFKTIITYVCDVTLSVYPHRASISTPGKLSVRSFFVYRTCIPAEAEPTLNSSSCYPLVNFTRPFCQNHGITLPNYVYQTPYYQNKKNYDFNQAYDGLKRLGVSKLSSLFNVDISTTRKCIQLFAIFCCHHRFPSCDGTQGVFKKQTICRESCLELTHICHKISDIFVQYDLIRFPKHKKLYDCELKHRRNAGDSPECWYFNGFANYTGKITDQRGFRRWCEDLYRCSHHGIE